MSRREGGLRAAEKNRAKDPDFYVKLGKMGGSVKGLKKGFAADPTRASKAGRKGGSISKRGRGKKWESMAEVSKESAINSLAKE